MNPLEGLAQYLDRLERRLRLFAWTRGAAAVAAAALVLTVVIVSALMLFTFAPSGLIAGRFVLFLGIGAAIAVGLIVPLMRLNRRKAAQEVEHSHPGFDQRLLTFTERSRANAADPFLPLLAEDALVMARGAAPEQVVKSGRFIQFGSIAAVAVSVLVWLMFWGPGVFGYGTALLWGSYPKDANSKSFYSITVQPGSKTIRRKTDVLVSAKLSGFITTKANIYVQYASSAKWEAAPMQPEAGGPGFGFLLPSVPEDVQYYVEAGGLKSDTFKIHTIELPTVKNIRVTYTFPSWTGMAAMTEDPGGDLRAVEGTVAKVEITTDKPLSAAQLAVENGKPIDLTSAGANKLIANVPIEKDGSYHVAVMDHGESVRLTDDYFIEARKVGAPVVHITKPGKDQKVSPIEEVAVALSAEDEYPLTEFALHYSVNAGAEKTVSMLKGAGQKHVEGSTMLSMEEFKAVPGDIISIYATAKDGKNTTKTDMFFIEAVPFEFEYTQSQESGGGGGGGGGDQDQQISEREKEIIAATFNQLKGDAKAKATAADTAKYLSDVQAKLRDQAQSLANRMKARQLDGNGAGFTQFVKEMEAAVAAMSPASDKLKGLAFQDALTPEQQALQHLLRAESTFRQIQVQVSKGGGGGGGGGGAGRDLANLFDLELDKDKNQYETNANSAAEAKQQQIDDALKKLEELARRQQELAQQQQNAQQMAQQRYQQEMLRREAEELKRQMEQLQRGDQGQQGQQSQSGQQSASSQGGQSGQQSSGQQSSGQQSSGQQSSGQQSGQQSSSSSNSQSSQGSQSGQQQQSARNQPQTGQQGQKPQQQPMSRQQQASNEQLQRAIQQLEQATRDMSNSASSRQGQGGQGSQAQNEAQAAAERLKQAGQTLESMRHQQNGSAMGQMADEAEKLASQQHQFEDKLKQAFGRGQGSQAAADQLVKDKQKLLDEYNQLQKEMQQTARDLSATQPSVSKELRDTMGRSQQSEIGTRMEVTQSALEQGMGQYAILREAPVTRALDQLRDELQALREEAASGQKSAGAGGSNEDKSAIAMQQALNQAEKVRREIEQLGRAGQNAQNGQGGQQGQKPGQGNQQGNQPGQQAGNQPGQGRQGGQQQASGSQPGQGQQGGQQSGQGQQGGQQGQQGGQQAGGQQSASGGPMNGGGYGTNASNRGGAYGGAWDGRTGPFNNGPDSGTAWDGRNVDPQQAYNDLQRDLGRMRSAVGDDKDLNRELQDLQKRAQDLDPKHWTNQGQLDSVVGAQVLSEVDQLELVLRRKLQANDGSVRSANPRNTPPGYADAVAEYYKRLSKQ